MPISKSRRILVASLVSALALPALAVAQKKSAKSGETVHWYGVNKSKGTGDCGGSGHSCANQNSCKGQGYVDMGKDTCLRIEQDAGAAASPLARRPNIVLILFDDLSPRIGAFGDSVAHTPVLDALAKDSVRYPNAFATSPVCAPSRSALLTGVHQQTLGTMQMRTTGAPFQPKGQIDYEAVPPGEVKAFPELLRAAGYYTVILGKKDYQFGDPFTMWDRTIRGQNETAVWNREGLPHLPKDRPFFAYINLHRTHESFNFPKDAPYRYMNADTSAWEVMKQSVERVVRDLADEPRATDPAKVKVPPYLPDTPTVRTTLAQLYDNIAVDEKNVAGIVESLKNTGALNNTIVIVSADQGSGIPREKAFAYAAGLRVPLMIRFPDGRNAGTLDERLVSLVDVAPTILSMAGVTIPQFVQGSSLLNSRAGNRYVFGAGDRVDESPERMKTAIDGRFQYIRNYRADLPLFRHSMWYDVFPIWQEYFQLWEEEKLTDAQRRYFEAPRARDELYDLNNDPHTMNNLADDPGHQPVLARMQKALDDWIGRTGDLTAVPEPQLIEKMWPGGKQPHTEAPNIQFIRREGSIVALLSSPTPNASIAYSFDEPPRPTDPNSVTVPQGTPDTPQIRAGLAQMADTSANNDKWQLYTGPIAVRSNQQLWVKAIRYGYRASEIVSGRVPSLVEKEEWRNLLLTQTARRYERRRRYGMQETSTSPATILQCGQDIEAQCRRHIREATPR